MRPHLGLAGRHNLGRWLAQHDAELAERVHLMSVRSSILAEHRLDLLDSTARQGMLVERPHQLVVNSVELGDVGRGVQRLQVSGRMASHTMQTGSLLAEMLLTPWADRLKRRILYFQ